MRFKGLITSLTVNALLISALASRPVFAQENTLQPFATDGCSMMLDGLPGDLPNWRHCCVAHDRDYWLGGTEAQRAASDARLAACISKAASPMLASFVYDNVRWGGSPLWLTSYRWGYGWPYWDVVEQRPRGYKAISADEQLQAEQLTPAADALLDAESAENTESTESTEKAAR